MEEIIFALIVITKLGNMEPMLAFMPATPFSTEEQCEERLITYLSEGFRISKSYNEQLMVGRQTQNTHTHATCIEMGIPVLENSLTPERKNRKVNAPPEPLILDDLGSVVRPKARASDALLPPEPVFEALEEAFRNPASSTPIDPLLLSVMIDKIKSCWIVGASSSAARFTTVVVGVEFTIDGKPLADSISLLDYEGGNDESAKQAFRAAKRAILRCGAQGFELPAEQYSIWRNIEFVFNPAEMRMP